MIEDKTNPNMESALRSVKIATDSFPISPYLLAVEAIEHDIRDRRGLKNEWSAIDPSIRNDIKETWLEIIKECYRKYGKS
jgi:hypothetical protein